jgi:hypothetical protein
MKTHVLMHRALYDARFLARRPSMDCHDKGGHHAIARDGFYQPSTSF